MASMTDHSTYMRLKLFVVALLLFAYCSQAAYVPARRETSGEVVHTGETLDIPEVGVFFDGSESSVVRRLSQSPAKRAAPVKPAPVKPAPVKPTPAKPTTAKPTPAKPTSVKPPPAPSSSVKSSAPAVPKPSSKSTPVSSAPAKPTSGRAPRCKVKPAGAPKPKVAARELTSNRPPTSLNHLSRRALFDDWDRVRRTDAANFVAVGGSKVFTLVLGQSKDFATSQFEGCTGIIVLKGRKLVFVHAREGSGAGCSLDSAAQTEKDIIERLLFDPLLEVDAGCAIRGLAYIKGATIETNSNTGVQALKGYLQGENVALTDMKYQQYLRGAKSVGDSDFTPNASGKLLVRWISPDATGGTIQIFDVGETPKATVRYDANFNVVGTPTGFGTTI